MYIDFAKKGLATLLALALIGNIGVFAPVSANDGDGGGGTGNIVTLPVEKDIFVMGGGQAGKSQGTAESDNTAFTDAYKTITLRNNKNSIPVHGSAGYLKFDLIDITNEVTSAKLKVYLIERIAGGRDIIAGLSRFEDFDEKNFTFNSAAPGEASASNDSVASSTLNFLVKGLIPGSEKTVQEVGWYEIDVTKGINECIRANKDTVVLTLAAVLRDDEQFDLKFHSKENGDNALAPTLVVDTTAPGTRSDTEVAADSFNYTSVPIADVSVSGLHRLFKSFTLPTSALNDVTIEWTSDKPEIISNSGVVNRPTPDRYYETVGLTATFKKDDCADTVRKYYAIAMSLRYPTDDNDIRTANKGDSSQYVQTTVYITDSANRYGLMKFGLSGISGTVKTATVKLRATADFTVTDVKVMGFLDNEWIESGINYDAHSKYALSPITLPHSKPANNYLDIDVTDYLNEMIYTNPGRTMSLILSRVNGTGDIRFYTKENPNSWPELTMVKTTDEDEIAVIEDTAKLSLTDEGLDNMQLPATGDGETTITWVSQDPSIITNAGAIQTRPEPGENTISATMQATITKGSYSKTKSVILTIQPKIFSYATLGDAPSSLTEAQLPAAEGFTVTAAPPSSSGATDVILCAALYDASNGGRITDVKFVSTGVGTVRQLEIPAAWKQAGCNVKIFLWDSFGTVSPYTPFVPVEYPSED